MIYIISPFQFGVQFGIGFIWAIIFYVFIVSMISVAWKAIREVINNAKAFEKQAKAAKKVCSQPTKIKPTRGKPGCQICHNDLKNKREMAIGMHVACARLNAPKPWSMKHPCCVICASTKRPHHSKGRCRTCFSRTYKRPTRKK